MKVLGVTLARGGSKGIPKKNIKMIAGLPLMVHTIEAALRSDVFDHYIVSTDCEDIASMAVEYGAHVPFMRPAKLSGDKVWSRDALKHAVLEAEKHYKCKYDYVMELPAVAPLRDENHIKDAFIRMVKANPHVDSVTSVTPIVDKHPKRMKRITEEGWLIDLAEFPEGEGSRRQDLEQLYIRNGAIFMMTRNCIVEKFSRHGDICLSYIMPNNVSVNIDTMIDFKLAEVLLNG